MIKEEIMYTEPEDIPRDYYYDTETPDFYVYRHKYTGKEIHIAKNPKTYINIQKYINEILDKIREEIKQEAYDDISGLKLISVNRVNQIIDRHKTESEDKK